jgi:hypothetical protein
MMLLVDESNVESMWPYLLPGLSRAEYSEEPGSVYSVEDLLERLLSGELSGYYQVESGYAGVFSVIQYPRRKVLCTFLGGKDESKSSPLDLEELDSFLTEVGKLYGCDTILVEGRKGWERWTKHLGYSTSTINLYKGISQ